MSDLGQEMEDGLDGHKCPTPYAHENLDQKLETLAIHTGSNHLLLAWKATVPHP